MESKPALHGKVTVARQETQERQPWVAHFALDLKPCDVAAGSLILTEAGGHIAKRDDLYVFSAVDIDGDWFPTDIFG